MLHDETITVAASDGSLTAPFAIEASEALHRVLASPEFATSAQLSRFLRYIVEASLGDNPASLKESCIGVEVFRRGTGYDPKVDPIVRVEARRLRVKLESYYAGAGAHDPVRITIPKGGYAARFVREGILPVPTVAVSMPLVGSVPVQAAPSRRPAWRLITVAVGGVALLATVWAIRSASEPQRLVSHFWSTVLDSGQPTLVVAADSGLVMWQDLTHRQATLHDYITGEYRDALGSGVPDAKIASLGQRRYTSIADVDLILRVSRRAEASQHGIRVRYARDLRADELQAGSLILLGARHSNPWVELFEPDAAFRIEHDEVSSAFRVINRRPEPGEPREIVISPETLKQDVYGLVSYHRNRAGKGVVLMVGGTSVVGTEAAADLLLDDAKLLPWLRRAAEGDRIRGFDVLLRDRNLNGGAPRAEVFAFRVEP